MDSSSKLNSSNTTKPMGELVSSNNTSLSFSSNNINNNNNNNNNINIGGSSSNSRIRSKEMENLSFEISKYPRDLLQRFLGGNNNQTRRNYSINDSNIGENDEDDDDEGGLNLGLGLSLGGKFGVDKSNKGLIRSSSIASTMPLFREDDDGTTLVGPPQPPPHQPPSRSGGGGGGGGLVRTSSLPVETEEEWRKRKEMQTLRRMEAKRRRSEKQRVFKDGGGGGGGGEEKGVEGLKFRGRLEREQQSLGITSKFIGSSMGNLFGSSTPPMPVPVASSTNVEVKGRRTTFGSLQGFLIAQGHAQGSGLGQGQGQGSSQGSGESQGATSSGASELESKTHQASSSCGEARSPASTQSLQERPSQDSSGSPGTIKGDTSQREGCGPDAESSAKQPKATENKPGPSSGIEDMPCVFTIGDGPNGRKVEGILYRYGKGEQVRIMCVCHGTFLSPQDFVKHAGGRDVEHPLRHIVVSPSSTAFQ
ncbi:hypothetical protein RND81_02G211500 [Saponaria officinalis]|uniref:Ninja-family protein n=1 Tax=Saponaria officinalis TaxID=3572 RepID=A0AAW1MV88_SAPOF